MANNKNFEVKNGITVLGGDITFSTDADTKIERPSEDVLSIEAGGQTGLTLTEVSGHVIETHNADATITAYATGGQANATALLSSFNRVSTCATANDSVKLTTPALGIYQHVTNDTNSVCDLYPDTGHDLGQGTNVQLTLDPDETAIFIGIDSTTWLRINDFSRKADRQVRRTAGESLVSGDVCYINSSGKMIKADASAASTASGLLYMCAETLSLDDIGWFIRNGDLASSGLTAGDDYWLSETAGAITNTQPTTSGAVIRFMGTALSATLLAFDPSKTVIELN